ncbi:hypothetical protein AB0E69_12810 [Kribbella sp. NPDC026611]|uniref:hypothetical protein n=1 Tax=Kribbella sp. NPDC026611 TaxID=3154911 RepID=UPI0033DE29E9
MTGDDGMEVFYPSPIRERQCRTADGVVWRMRRGEFRWRRVERQMRDPAVRVLHVYLSDMTEVPPSERDSLVARVRLRLTDPSGYGGFTLAVFDDGARGRMVVVEEYC